MADDRLKLERVRLCMDLFGKKAARALWREMQLGDAPAARCMPTIPETVRTFAVGIIVSDKGGRISTATVFDAYKAWCSSRGDSPESRKIFGRSMLHLGYKRHKVSRTYYTGVALAEQARGQG